MPLLHPQLCSNTGQTPSFDPWGALGQPGSSWSWSGLPDGWWSSMPLSHFFPQLIIWSSCPHLSLCNSIRLFMPSWQSYVPEILKSRERFLRSLRATCIQRGWCELLLPWALHNDTWGCLLSVCVLNCWLNTNIRSVNLIWFTNPNLFLHYN